MSITDEFLCAQGKHDVGWTGWETTDGATNYVQRQECRRCGLVYQKRLWHSEAVPPRRRKRWGRSG